MRDVLRVAAVQLNSGADKARNIADGIALVEQAAARGATFVALPEVWTYMGPSDANRDMAEPIPGETVERMADVARRERIWLHCGSILERAEGEPRVFNTSVVLDPDGNIVGRYRKIHLFDIDIDGAVSFQESATVAPGDEIVTVDIGGVTLGLAICYDLRFPELFRLLALQGAEIITLPAAFTQYTGKDHWEVLLRARAIENQVFMVAPAEYGKHPGGSTTWGRSMIVDPWGTVLATAADGPGVIVSDCDLNTLERIRREVPSLANRRPGAYRWVEEAVGVH